MTWRECREGISIVASDITVSGSYTFNADKTFQADLTISGSITQRIPAGCPTLGGQRLPCPQLGPAMSRPGNTVSCTGTDTCTCTSTLSGQEVGSGTYESHGTSLYRYLDSRAAPMLQDYCATPTSLTLTRNNDVGDVTGPMDSTFRSVFVFAKE
jgi:hypothetical protein